MNVRHRTRPLAAAVGLTVTTALAAGAINGSAATPKVPRIPSSQTSSGLKPPKVTVTIRHKGLDKGYLFLAPKLGKVRPGALIADSSGRPVYFHPTGSSEEITDFRVQTYLGKPALTYWQGDVALGHGSGSYLILNKNYRRIGRVRAGNGLQGDLHEFRLTNRGSALITIYVANNDTKTFDSVFQEISLKTGKVLFQWSAKDHIPLSESRTSAGALNGYTDPFHLNSVDLLPDGNFLVSARNTSTIYKVNRKTGAIMWRLGGDSSNFKLGAGAAFNFQHDAQPGPNGTITLFDNGGAPKVEDRSRAMQLSLDNSKKTATLVRDFTQGDVFAFSQGNFSLLPNGNAFVGFGSTGIISEFSPAGRLLLSAHLDLAADTYRAYRSVWHGFPAGRPFTSATRTPEGVTVKAEWDGATEVRTWRVLTGPSAKKLKTVGDGRWLGLATNLQLKSSGRYVEVRGLDGRGRVLGTSKVVSVG